MPSAMSMTLAKMANPPMMPSMIQPITHLLSLHTIPRRKDS
jgi:hypothetical protein